MHMKKYFGFAVVEKIKRNVRSSLQVTQHTAFVLYYTIAEIIFVYYFENSTLRYHKD